MVADERLLSTGQLARVLGVSPTAIRDWQAAGAIHPAYVTPGNHARWRLADVRAELESNRRKSE